MKHVPRGLQWLFWNLDFARLDLERDADTVLARVLEYGRTRDVRWAMKHYGLARIRRFFREVGDPELSERTVRFWRCLLNAKDEPWRRPPAWRRNSSALWID
ncbi:MAG: DUF6922 domain-containing protein [Myxococcaceae bacterium]